MGYWMNLGQIQKLNAKKFPGTVALRDAARAFTYPQMNSRINKLANSLFSLGLQKGDKIAVLLENCIEICELFMATAKAGIIIVPINFRLVSAEVEYIVNNSDAKAMVVHDQFAHIVEPIRSDLKNIDAKNYIIVGKPQDRYRPYENFISASTDTEPDTDVAPLDTWILIYTSGTTGDPKGVLLSHGNFTTNFQAGGALFPELGPDTRSLCILPWAHSFGQTAELHMLINFGGQTGFAESPQTIVDDLALCSAQPIAPTVWTCESVGVTSPEALGVDRLPAVDAYVRTRSRAGATVAWAAYEGPLHR